MAYRSKKITFEAALKNRDVDGLTRLSKKFERLTAPIDRLNYKLKLTKAAISPITKRVDKLSKSLSSLGLKIAKGLGAGAGTVGAFSLFESANFESELLRLETLTKATLKQKEAISELAEEINKTTQFTGVDALKGMKYLNMSGMDYSGINKSINPTMYLTGAAQLNSEIDLKRTADIFSNILTSYFKNKDPNKKPSDYAVDTADKLAYAFSNANFNLEELGGALEMFGGLADPAGVSFDQSLALLMTLSGSGIKGEKAGTALAGASTRLLNLTPEAKEILKKHNLTKEERQKFLGDDGKIENFIAYLSYLHEKGVKPGDLMKILGQESGKYIIGIKNQHEDIASLVKKIEEESSGEAKRLNDVSLEGFWGNFKLLTSSVSALAKKIGDNSVLSWGTSLVKYLKKITDYLNNNSDRFFKSIAAILTTLATISASLITIAGLVKIVSVSISGYVALKTFLSTLGAFLATKIGLILSVPLVPLIGVLAGVAALLEGIDYLFNIDVGPISYLVSHLKKLVFPEDNKNKDIENIKNKAASNSKSTVEVNFKNMPQGSTVKTKNKNKNINIYSNLGFATIGPKW